jgi:hypothetical protein
MELSRPRAFSELVGRRVEDAGGRTLGHVFEVRAGWDGDGNLILDELLVGRGALWRRLRGPGQGARGIPWQTITELSAERIVVATGPQDS